MTKEEFKQQFVMTFVGSWCAKHYEDACMMGDHKRLYTPPIEDAEDIADEIWARNTIELERIRK